MAPVSWIHYNGEIFFAGHKAAGTEICGSFYPGGETKEKEAEDKKESTSSKLSHDGIYKYAKDTLTLGLLLMEH